MTAVLHDNVAILMFAALGLLIFSGLPVAFVLMGVGVAFGLIGYGLGLVRLTDFGAVYFRVYGTLGDPEDIAWSAVPLLVFMGAMLQQSGIARELLSCLHVLLRRIPGGLAVAVSLIGVILAPMAGMVGAGVGTLALIALPPMLEQGYKPSFAAGVVAAAGTLGVALPPGIMLFFLADAMGMQVPFIFLAMIGPGLLLFALYVGYYVLVSLRDHDCAPATSPVELATTPARPAHFVQGLVLPVGLIALILGGIIGGWTTLSESAALGAAGAVVLAALCGTLSLRRVHTVIAQTTVMTAMVFLIFVAASLFSLVFRLLGGVERVAGFLTGLSLGNWGTLALVLGVIFVLGCFIDWLEIVLISFVIFRPVLDSLDFSGHIDRPYLAFGWITILIVLALQSSFITPPFGFALFFLRGSAPPGVRMADIYRGIVPFIVIQIIAIGCVAAVPQLTTWLPDQLLDLRTAVRGIKANE
jgi:tripartite ATP-independent transporter DctM subunit